MSVRDAAPEVEGSTRDQNDTRILNALTVLKDPVKRAKQKLKFTVPSLCKLTGLSTNTIRSREWALKALRDAKAEAKLKPGQKSDAESAVAPEVTLVEALRYRVKSLLSQNTLLFDEILTLRAQLQKCDELIKELQGKRLTCM